MAIEKTKVLLDFDGNLTDEKHQAAELASVALELLADVLGVSQTELEALYAAIKKQIQTQPHLYPWEINGLPACYAIEGAYLLNTVILQQIIKTEPRFLSIVANRYPTDTLDPVTKCVNYLFHTGSFSVNPHFLPDTRDFLIALLENPSLDPTIFTNSETRKIRENLKALRIGTVGADHPYSHEIGILGDTRQYHLNPSWDNTFFHYIDDQIKQIQVLHIDDRYQVDLRRPIYHAALKREMARGYQDVIVIADGFSLAGALPLMMGLSFILHKTDYTPAWAEDFTAAHPKGRVLSTLPEIETTLRERVTPKPAEKDSPTILLLTAIRSVLPSNQAETEINHLRLLRERVTILSAYYIMMLRLEGQRSPKTLAAYSALWKFTYQFSKRIETLGLDPKPYQTPETISALFT